MPFAPLCFSDMRACSKGIESAGLSDVSVPPEGIEDSDFELIEAAVRETERGRWFLDEFARRIRASETASLIRAIDRLEGRAAARQKEDEQDRYYIQRAIALLVPLVEFLKGQEPDPPFPAPDDQVEVSDDDDPDARASVLDALDALSVADKLKLFR